MNHLYRSLWNDVTRTFVAVAEVASGRGKRSSGSRTAGTGEVAVEPARTLLRPMALEPRLMFDAAAVATAAESVHASVQSEADAGHAAALAEAARQLVQVAPPAVTSDRHEVAFIDTNVEGWQALRDGLAAGVEVVLLDGRQDGLAQMAQWASTHSGYDAIHVLSHGFEGGLFLGSSRVDTAALNASAAQLSAIGASLTAQGDILLYGCNVAKGAGQAFAERLAALTGADVAASSDATGAAGKGGDWVLEASVGSVEAASLSGLTGYDGLLVAGSAFVSGSTSDVTKELNVNIGLEKLSNGNTAVAYLSQVAGDYVSTDYANDPTAGYVLFDGVVKVLDGSNNVVRTINLRSDFSLPASQYVMGAAIESLANGGFVVAWTQADRDVTSPVVKYAIYDNAGSLQSSGTLAAGGQSPSIAAQANGDFAIAYQTYNAKQQVAVSVFDYGGSGFSFTPLTQTLVGDATAAVAGADADTNRLYFNLTPPVLSALSDGSYVFTANTYDWVSSTYTPLGVFAFKIDAAGALANFASGKSWQRVDWDSSQSAPASVQAFNGGYAVVAQKVVSGTTTWQVTVYDNDGSLRTATQQTAQVYNNGSFFSKTYYAVDIDTMNMAIHDELSYVTNPKALSATMYDNGTDLVLVFPTSGGGLKTATISKTTGQLVGSVTGAGITVPAGGVLINPRFVADGVGGYDITYSVLSDKDSGDGATSGYVVGDIYQIGLDVVPSNAAPVATGLGGDSVAWAGVGNVVTLDAGGNATVSDAEFGALNGGNGDWAGGSLVVSRPGSAVSADVFGFNLSGASFTVSGSNLQSGGLTFATFTNTGGVLTISFTSSGTAATTALAQDVARHISYRNDTPAGNATLRFTLSDGSASTTADVTVTSDTVYITNNGDTSTLDASDGTGLREAVAIALNQSGSQTLILSSAMVGATITLGSTLSITESLTLDADAASGLTVTGSTLSLGGGSTLTWQSGSGDTANIGSTLSGSGALVIASAGVGRLTLDSASNSAGWTGAMSVTGGTLQVGADAALSTGTLTLNGGRLDNNGASFTIDNAIVLGAGGGTVNVSNASQTLTLSGVISGSGALSKTNGGVLVLTGTNTYSGGTTIAGTNGLMVNDGSNLGSGAVNLNTRLTVTNAATVTNNIVLGGGGGTVVNANALTLSGTLSGGSFTKSGAGTLTLSNSGNEAGMTGGMTVSAGTLSVANDDQLAAGTLTLNGGTLAITGATTVDNAITVSADSTINASANATLSGNISGGAYLSFYGSATLTLTGSNGSFSGPMLVGSGTLSVAGAGNLGTGGIGVGAGTLNFTDDATVTNVFDLFNPGASIAVSAGKSVTLSGQFDGSDGFSKTGSGTLTLSGPLFYDGDTTVSAGTLLATTLGDSPNVNVAAGATLGVATSVLSGSGLLTVQSGGTLRPLSGILTVDGSLLMQAGSTLAVDIRSSSDYDALLVNNGTVAVTGANLAVTHSYTPGLGDSYLIIDNSPGGAITGTFAGLSEGGTLSAAGNGTGLTASYVGWSGNDFVLTAPLTSPPTVGNLGGDSQAYSAGATVLLDVGGNATVSDAEDDVANWNGGSLVVQRVTGGTADATANDLFGFDLAGAGFTVSGNNLQAGGQTFATFTNSGGVLTVSFTGSGTAATTTLVQDLVRHINYRNDTPYGDATLRFALTGSDGITVNNSVTLTSSTIYVDVANDDAGGDAADGFSLREALARGAAQAGADNITVQLANGSTITLGSGVTSGAGDTLDLDGAHGLTVTGSTLTLGGALSISNGSGKTATLATTLAGSGTLDKSGAGTLTLGSTSNSAGWSGGLTVSAGVVSIASDAQITAGTLTLDGGQLTLNGFGGGALDNAIVLGASGGTINASNSAAVASGAITGSGGLAKTGGQLLTLTGTNTYSGGTTISGADGLAVNDASSLGSGAVTLNTRLQVLNATTLANNIVLGNVGTATIVTDANVTLSGVVSGSGTLQKTGASTLTLSGSNTHSGSVDVTAGGLTLQGGASLGDGSAVTVSSGATLTLGLGNETIGSLAGSGNVVLGYRLTTGGDNSSTVFSGVISGAGNGLTKAGSGTFTLSGANSFTGSTLVSAGTLSLSNGSAIADTSAVTVASGATLRLHDSSETLDSLAGAGTVTLNGGSLTLSGNSSTTFSGVIQDGGLGSQNLVKLGSGTQTLSGANTYSGTTAVLNGTLAVVGDASLGGGAVTLNGGTLSVTGAGTIDNAIAIGVNEGFIDASAAVTLSGALSGSDTLYVQGSGSLTLSNSGNAGSFSGGTTVLGGTLNVASDAMLGAGTLTLNSGTLTLTAATTIDNALQLTGTGGTVMAAAAATLSGGISGPGGLGKTGSAALTLSGTGSYTGSTAVQAGSLVVTGALNGTSSLTVASGATLAGTGSIGSAGTNGLVVVNAGGTLAPGLGAGSTGTLTLLRGLTMYSGATLQADVRGSVAGSGYDQLAVTGVVNLNGGTLSLDLGSYTAATGETYRLIDNDGSDAVLQTFAGLAQGASLTAGNGRTLGVSYAAGTGNDVVLTALNAAPTVANALTAQAATEDSAFAFTVPANTFADADVGDTLTYAATLADGSALPGWLSFDAATRSFSGTPLNGDVGAITVKVTATDGSNATASSNFTLTVANTNDAPTGIAIAAQAATEDSAFSFTVPANTFADVDAGDTLTYAATLADGSALPGWLSFNATTRAFSGTPLNGDVGAITVKVTATDGSNAAASSNFTLTVANTNDVPTVANALTAQAATEDSAFSFTVPANTFADVDAGDTLTYAATLADGSALPGWLSFNATTRVFSGTPLNGDVGAITVKVTATDGSNATASSNFTLTVANTNDVPTVANALTAQAATEDVAFSFTVPANTFADVDAGDTLSYAATLADGSALPAWLSFDAATRSFSGTPSNGDVGAITVKVTATDGSNAGVASNFTLTVANVNDAPTLANALTAQAATEEAAFSFTVPANAFADVDAGDTLSYAATLADGSALPAWLSFNAATRTFSGTPANGDVGAIGVRVTATDGSNASVSSNFALTVVNTNDAPTVANALTAQAATEDSAFGFTVPANTFADVDAGDTLTYTATLANGSALPAWLSFNAATRTFSGTPANGDVGAISVRVTATDGGNASASSDFTLTVANTNDAPTSIAIAAQAATEDSAFSFSVPANTFADVDVGDTLTYTATLANGSALPAWLSFNAATRTFSGTPANGDVGAIAVKVTATDASNASASSNFTLTVANTNDAPTAGPIPFQSVAEDSAFVFTVPANTFADVDVGDTLTYTATLANGAALPVWLSFDATTRTFSGTPANGDVGIISVTVTATDAGRASASSTFGLFVSSTNDVPTVAVPIAAQAATEDSAFSFTVPANTFSDVDVGDTLSYTALLADGSPLPAWLSFNTTTRTFSGTPANGDVGAITVKVTATDASYTSASSNFTLTVANTNDAPTASAIAAQAATEDSAFSFTVPANTFADVDAGDTLTYTATLANGSPLPAWLSFNTTTRTFSGTPANGDVGTISVKVTATDAGNASVSSGFTLTVANTNDAPTVGSPITTPAATAKSPYSFTLPANSFVDADAGDTLGYRATLADGAALPGWLSFNAATRTFSGTPTNGDAGAITVRVTATDASNASVSASFTLTVEPVAELPLPETPPVPVPPSPPPVQAPIADVAATQLPAAVAFLSTGDTGVSLQSQLQGVGVAPTLLPPPPPSPSFVSVPPLPTPAGNVAVAAPAAAERQGAPLSAVPDLGDFRVRSGQDVNVKLPDNFFTQVSPDTAVTIEARLSDGRPLPSWMRFDPGSKTLTGRPPAGLNNSFSIEIIIRDAKGNRATSHLDVEVRPNAVQPGASLDERPTSRSGLSEQLRSARLQQRSALGERLAAAPRAERGGATPRG